MQSCTRSAIPMPFYPLILRSGAILTKKEHAVFVLLAYGYDCPAIAEQLCMSSGTVETHRQHIYHKGNFSKRRDVLLEAVYLGIMTREYHELLMMSYNA
ncbi:helix-turn-helix transcriptional regulator [Chloroflexia bacterium SDU3-3]|nr:helix-turn-helix transcriptional regulator [Chloroflexia bacterium SDU3-3]